MQSEDSPSENLLASYAYELPEGRIRGVPVEPRHDAKLLVYDTKNDTIIDTTFFHLADHLPEKTRIVLNTSKVLPVRLSAQKETGGKVEVFVLANELKDEGRVPCLLDAKVHPGSTLSIAENVYAEVLDKEGTIYHIRFSGLSLEEIMERYGSTPLPHYIHSDLSEEAARKRYQTIFAEPASTVGSVAAPTASLHFTQEVFDSLKRKKCITVPVTLHVGRGTFATLRKEQLVTKELHPEWYEVSASSMEALKDAHARKEPILAVGTTAMRVLESCIATGNEKGETRLFITPPHEFTYATMMLTNFHLPKTSLMMLVDAFLRHKGARRGILDIYRHAIDHGYQFYSFGDSMLIL